MRFSSLLLWILATVPVSLCGQSKKVLDSTAIKIWNQLDAAAISPDGKWYTYEIKNESGYQLLVVGNGTTADSFPKASAASFNASSRYFLFTKDAANGKGRSFQLLDLHTKEITELKGYLSATFTGVDQHSLQLIRQIQLDSASQTKTKKTKNLLVLYDPLKKDSLLFNNVSSHRFSKEHHYLMLLQDTGSQQQLSLYHFPSRRQHKILSGKINLNMVAFSPSSDWMLCLVDMKERPDTTRRIYLVKTANGRIMDSIVTSNSGLKKGHELALQNQLTFAENGTKFFFKTALPKQPDTVAKKNLVISEIWKWDGASIPPMKKGEDNAEAAIICQYSIRTKQITQLSDDEMIYLQFPEGKQDNITIGFSDLPYRKLEGTEAGTLYDSYIVDMNTGAKKLVLERKYYTPKISIDKQFISWYEPEDSSWYSMNTRTLEKRNLTRNLPDIFYNDELDIPMHSTFWGEAGWDADSHWVLVPGKYDYWKIDAAGKLPPVCLTGFAGQKQGITFRRIKFNKAERYADLSKVQYFTAFQNSTKKDGYYRLHPDGKFEQLIFSDASYGGLKIADNQTACLWRKESFTDYPELYFSDASFGNIRKVSVTNPQQQQYWWGTNSLVEWESFSKDSLQGILCKPENFDPTKKYPMIVYFYEKRSDQLHRYNVPDNIKSVVNWSYCVSNGYLVFIPDVVFRTAEPGASAYDAIVSGVSAMISKYDFIDRNRIGINGHSWGGYQAAYLVTKTPIFKAAVAGAVVSNMTSAYGGIRWETGRSRISQYESGQSRMGTTLWSNPLAYVNNSPLFGIPNVNTPVLLMHNDQDGAVPWEQGIEFFMGLRRMNKPAWLINYKGEGHLLKRKENKADYTQKVMGFFDHYLKDAPKPDWM